MEVIGQYAKTFQYPVTFYAGFKQALFKSSVGTFINKNILAVVTSVDYVINSICFFNAKTPSHNIYQVIGDSLVNYKINGMTSFKAST